MLLKDKYFGNWLPPECHIWSVQTVSDVVRRITSLLPMRGLSRCPMTDSRREIHAILDLWKVEGICQRDPSLSYSSEGHFFPQWHCILSGRASVTWGKKRDVKYISKYGISRDQRDRWDLSKDFRSSLYQLLRTYLELIPLLFVKLFFHGRLGGSDDSAEGECGMKGCLAPLVSWSCDVIYCREVISELVAHGLSTTSVAAQ